MKKATLCALGAAMALSAGSASAQIDPPANYITITGATAFRAFAHNSIKSSLGANVKTLKNITDLNLAGTALFTDGTTYVLASWSGSVGGLQSLTNQTVVRAYYNPVDAEVIAALALLAPGGEGVLTTTGNTTNYSGNIAFADNFQSSSIYKTPTLAFPPGADESKLGVVAFRFVGSEGFPEDQNMTTNLFQRMWGSTGFIPLSMFTGNSGDDFTFIFATGRDANSGTRVIYLSETGLGTTTPIQQYQYTTTGTDAATYDLDVISPFALNGGYSSGGDIIRGLQATPDADGSMLVTGIAITDGNAAIAGGGVPLKYNGYDYSSDNVINGQYTYWSFEHLYYRSDLLAAKKTYANTLAADVRANAESFSDGAFKLTTLRVSRSGDGTPVFPTY